MNVELKIKIDGSEVINYLSENKGTQISKQINLKHIEEINRILTGIKNQLVGFTAGFENANKIY